MDVIGIFFSFRSVKTQQQVKKIIKQIGENHCEAVDVDTATLADFQKFRNYILAVPTWFDGELPSYWDEYLPMIEDESFKGKKFAIFGGADQKGYPSNFADGIGLMAEFVEERGGRIVGLTKAEGYSFESSRALRGNNFMGLVIDMENQPGLTNTRIEKWVDDIIQEFKSAK